MPRCRRSWNAAWWRPLAVPKLWAARRLTARPRGSSNPSACAVWKICPPRTNSVALLLKDRPRRSPPNAAWRRLRRNNSHCSPPRRRRAKAGIKKLEARSQRNRKNRSDLHETKQPRNDYLVEHGRRCLRAGRAGTSRLHGPRPDAAGRHQKRRGCHQVLDQNRKGRRPGNSAAMWTVGLCVSVMADRIRQVTAFRYWTPNHIGHKHLTQVFV